MNVTTDSTNSFDSQRKRHRDSNLELFRVIAMLLIIAHHYVVNSGLLDVISTSSDVAKSSIMMCLGGWGKTGINCFVLITGYFMCKSSISLEKLLKLYTQIVFYTLIIYLIFALTGKNSFTLKGFFLTLCPIKSISYGFVSCFLIFYLFIPVLNSCVTNLGQKLHLYVVSLIVIFFSLIPSIPGFEFSFNYTSWFISLYLIASYIRLYGIFPRISYRIWGIISLILITVSSLAVTLIVRNNIIAERVVHSPYFILTDCNKILPLAISVSSFLYFKSVRITYSKIINLMGAATFGVLLIHANSNTMREWLWKEVINCTRIFKEPTLFAVVYALCSILTIFIICSGIDWFRNKYIEPIYLTTLKKRVLLIKHKLSLCNKRH